MIITPRASCSRVRREARSAIVAETGASIDDDALAAIFRRALCASSADRAPYTISVSTCGRCERVWQTGAGAPIEVPPAVVERAQCDAVAIGHLDSDTPARASQTIPPAVRRLIVLLCTAHHDLHHRDELRIEGAWPALVFRHADGRPYGHLPPRPELEPEHVADVRAALVACGFDKRTAKASVDRALTHVGRDAPTEEVLRAAFRATKHVTR